jgi:hypothetical protein
MGDLETSLNELRQVIAADGHYAETAADDADFDALRLDAALGPEFDALVAGSPD